MKNGVSYLKLGIGLLTGTLVAYGQTPSPTAVAQSPVTAPPSGVLVTPQPGPVAVPPSGVLVTPPTDRRAVATVLVKTGRKERTAARPAPGTMRHHVVHLQSAGHRATVTRTVPVDQSIAAAPSRVSTTASQPPIDETGYEAFLTLIGKAKQAKLK
jgi:hypothetical protein